MNYLCLICGHNFETFNEYADICPNCGDADLTEMDEHYDYRMRRANKEEAAEDRRLFE